MIYKIKFTCEDAATIGATTAIIGAATGTYSAISSANKKSATIKQTSPVTQDTSISEADDLLRRRQRQGTQANNTGAAGTAINSSGQKTLLGG